ncbi:MAG: hypothetical protein A3K06_01420 [Candidatus Doudnabacteria bacterium RIFCSPHIGHO2_01_52_17]|uniref:AtpZ/AtpI family protein n=1 Tax=Candidatus Doudnabacteria bacterium RIFCSPHIGHO2_01_52_17 TaxID=1817820 RepID=A0A1F5NFR9_9BACT|nr:MAG: hypothetical protein A3K06_01420 [Candidatus Doudnabacteria bacterium RIFCSPHIGHO2_01_52_17]
MDSSEQKQNKPNLQKSEMVRLAFELGFIIALPVVAFGYFGKWLDQRSDTYPLLTLIGILAAIVSTSFWMYRKFRNYFKSSK